ncbi:hypothetical protein JKF63_07232 [Porcisia hertigi]|uniref:DOC domain-containing protein n=1 Tax=Porcisia hertigi TaxID=2761500 RepID=A0A836YHS9_9TRYP|nr:hypothetical protein JKF63_07232 [Porcisia hertigi]
MSLYNVESDSDGESSVEDFTQSRGGGQPVPSSSPSVSDASLYADLGNLPAPILSTPQLAYWVRKYNQMDVGGSCNTVWTVSSAKHGNGVHHLIRHHDLNSFWQSDGMLPHVIRIQLGQLTPVEAMAVYVNSAVDQSYSPRVIRVKAGTHNGDMTEVAKVDIGAGQVCGWVLIKLCEKSGDEELERGGNNSGGSSVGISGDAPLAQRHSQSGHSSQLYGGAPRATPSGPTSSSPPTIPYSEVAAALGRGYHAAIAVTPSYQSSSSSPTAGTQTSAAMPMNAHNPSSAADRWLWCTLIDVCICENQFNGRDCHLRGIRLMGPRYEEQERVSNADAMDTVASSRGLRIREVKGAADELRLR